MLTQCVITHNNVSPAPVVLLSYSTQGRAVPFPGSGMGGGLKQHLESSPYNWWCFLLPGSAGADPRCFHVCVLVDPTLRVRERGSLTEQCMLELEEIPEPLFSLAVSTQKQVPQGLAQVPTRIRSYGETELNKKRLSKVQPRLSPTLSCPLTPSKGDCEGSVGTSVLLL